MRQIEDINKVEITIRQMQAAARLYRKAKAILEVEHGQDEEKMKDLECAVLRYEFAIDGWQ